MNPESEQLLASYVEAGLVQIECGETIDLQALCGNHPELAEAVGEALAQLGDLPVLQREARDHDPWVGITVSGRYRIDSRLGSGAMGAVYQAFDQDLQREVAIKRIHPERVGPDNEARFLREAMVLASLDCDYLVRVFDRGRHRDGSLYLVMERLYGLSLAAISNQAMGALGRADAASFGRIDWLAELLPDATLERTYLRQLVVWSLQIAEGLAVSHSQGIFHRDVKPSNIHITESGRAVLLDFGIAVRLEDGALTTPGTSIGTPWYMAPEQASGGCLPDGRIDVYGLCASLYHLLCFSPPFDGDPIQVISRLQNEDPIAIGQRHRGLPRDLVSAVEQGMAREARHRYASAEDLRADFAAFLDHRALAARPLGALTRTWRRARRRPARALAITSSVALLVALALALPVWYQVAEAHAIDLHGSLVARLPALLTLEGYPAQRLLVDRYEREEALGALDQILSLRSDDLATRVLRIALLQDMGRLASAREDIEVLEALAPGPFMSAVAKRFASACQGRDAGGDGDGDGNGRVNVDMSELPDPQTDADRFVAGFFALRARTAAGYDRAYRWLSDAGDYGPARDLLQIALLAVEKWQAAHDAAIVLEGIYGRETGRTRHTLGAALLGLRRYEEAIPILERARDLCPGRHGPLQNLGVARLRFGDVDAAIVVLKQAHEIRPWLWNTLDALAQAHSAKGEFEAALACALRIPSEGSMGESWRRPYAIAGVHRQACFKSVRVGDREEALRRAGLAMDWYKTSARGGAPKSRRDAMRVMVAMLAHVASGSYGRAVVPWARALADAPLQALAIFDLANLLPSDGLDADATEALRLFLLELAAALAPGDPLPRAAADQQRSLFPMRTK